MTDQPEGWSAPDHSAAEQPAELPAGSVREAPPLAPHRFSGQGLSGQGLSGQGLSGQGVIPLRPLGVGELLDGAVAVIRVFPRPILAFAAAVSVLSGALELLVTMTLLGPITNTSTLTSLSDSLDTVLGPALIGAALTLFLHVMTGAVLAGIVTAVVGRAVFGTPTTVRDAWLAIRPRFGRLVLLSLLVALAVYGSLFGGIAAFALLTRFAGLAGAAVGALLAAVGAAAAVWLYLRWSLATSVLVLEQQNIRPALRRSSVLASRSWARIFGVLLLASVIAGFVGLVIQLPFQLLGSSPLSELNQHSPLSNYQLIVGSVAGALAATLVAPFSAGVRALLYLDRRMRAEGLDVALVAAANARRAG